MPNKHLRNDLNDSQQSELVRAHYVAAVILLVAAACFLALVIALDRVFDFSRFAY